MRIMHEFRGDDETCWLLTDVAQRSHNRRRDDEQKNSTKLAQSSNNDESDNQTTRHDRLLVWNSMQNCSFLIDELMRHTKEEKNPTRDQTNPNEDEVKRK